MEWKCKVAVQRPDKSIVVLGVGNVLKFEGSPNQKPPLPFTPLFLLDDWLYMIAVRITQHLFNNKIPADHMWPLDTLPNKFLI